MTSAWFAVFVAVIIELSLGRRLMILGVWLPITLICLLTLRQWHWITWSQGLLLAAICGYILDLMMSPRSGWVVIGMVLAMVVTEAIWWRGAPKAWLRPLVSILGLLIYWQTVELSFGLGVGWRDAYNAGLFVAVTALALWLVQSLTRRVARRL